MELVAVCDKDASRINARLDFNLGNEDTPLPEGIHIYSDVDELIANEDFDLGDVCLPTFLHKDVSIKLLDAGKHVLCEKPMAISYSDCLEMLQAEKRSGKKLMIAQVIRFDEAYQYLKEVFETGELGALDNLYMDRHSVYPTWGKSFENNAITGGCTLDTHIHDLDAARYVLGEPSSVYGLEFNAPPRYQAVTTNLCFGKTKAVISCSWDATYETKFTYGYRARFEGGSIVCRDGEIKLCKNGKEPEIVNIERRGGVYNELRYFLDAILSDTALEKNTAESSAKNVWLVEKIRESSERSEIIKLK